MIPKKYTSEQLLGRKCVPVRTIRNGAGECVSQDTVCTIKNVVRGHGITIQTDICHICGQSAYITGVSREELQFLEEETELAKIQRLLKARAELARELMSTCDEVTNFCSKYGLDLTNDDACLGTDVRIYCEFDGAYEMTLDAITKAMQKAGGGAIEE